MNKQQLCAIPQLHKTLQVVQALEIMNKKLILITLLCLLFSVSWSQSTVNVEQCIKGNCKNGQGTYAWANGDKYVGEFKDGNRTGQGPYTFADGDKYVGELKDGKIEGQGTFTTTNGDKYVGEWKGGKREGRGIFTYKNGSITVGIFDIACTLSKSHSSVSKNPPLVK